MGMGNQVRRIVAQSPCRVNKSRSGPLGLPVLVSIVSAVTSSGGSSGVGGGSGSTRSDGGSHDSTGYNGKEGDDELETHVDLIWIRLEKNLKAGI